MSVCIFFGVLNWRDFVFLLKLKRHEIMIDCYSYWGVLAILRVMLQDASCSGDASCYF